MHAHSSIYKKGTKDSEDKQNITKTIKVLQSCFIPCIFDMHLDNELMYYAQTISLKITKKSTLFWHSLTIESFGIKQINKLIKILEFLWAMGKEKIQSLQNTFKPPHYI